MSQNVDLPLKFCNFRGYSSSLIIIVSLHFNVKLVKKAFYLFEADIACRWRRRGLLADSAVGADGGRGGGGVGAGRPHPHVLQAGVALVLGGGRRGAARAGNRHGAVLPHLLVFVVAADVGARGGCLAAAAEVTSVGHAVQLRSEKLSHVRQKSTRSYVKIKTRVSLRFWSLSTLITT
jgi:hypothetical protein